MERHRIIPGVMNMHAATYVDYARSLAKRLEDAEAVRSEMALRDVRRAVASKAGVSPGTLENLRNGRLKAIAAHVLDALRGAVERELQNEIRRLEHDLQVLRQTGVDAREDQVGEVQRHLTAAKEALGRK
jgi:transcriptional regulator with XRE-family HTH domain